MNFQKKNIISCKEYCSVKKKELKSKLDNVKRIPTLAVVQIDDNKSSNAYINGKKKDCEEVGIEFVHFKLDSSKYTQEDLCKILIALSNDELINGIIVQLPIPEKYNIDELLDNIAPNKDVDGFRKDSCFESCTPKGIIDWLKYNNYDFTGKQVTVLGRSKIVGKPLVNMLIDRGSTVISCNSHTENIEKYTRGSDLVISAVGKANLFCCEMPENGIVVDVGINHDIDGKLCGDVNRKYVENNIKNTYVTSVPGGVGLLTRVALLDNVIKACETRKE